MYLYFQMNKPILTLNKRILLKWKNEEKIEE